MFLESLYLHSYASREGKQRERESSLEPQFCHMGRQFLQIE
ncbi:MAG: hypothetical protein ACI80L_000502 [Pseudohongiellaceae bacterium]|jgi:hypothetical protein